MDRGAHRDARFGQTNHQKLHHIGGADPGHRNCVLSALATWSKFPGRNRKSNQAGLSAVGRYTAPWRFGCPTMHKTTEYLALPLEERAPLLQRNAGGVCNETRAGTEAACQLDHLAHTTRFGLLLSVAPGTTKPTKPLVRYRDPAAGHDPIS